MRGDITGNVKDWHFDQNDRFLEVFLEEPGDRYQAGQVGLRIHSLGATGSTPCTPYGVAYTPYAL